MNIHGWKFEKKKSGNIQKDQVKKNENEKKNDEKSSWKKWKKKWRKNKVEVQFELIV